MFASPQTALEEETEWGSGSEQLNEIYLRSSMDQSTPLRTVGLEVRVLPWVPDRNSVGESSSDKWVVVGSTPTGPILLPSLEPENQASRSQGSPRQSRSSTVRAPAL